MRTPIIVLPILCLLAPAARGDTASDSDKRDALVAAVAWSAPHDIDRARAEEHVDAALAAVAGTDIDPAVLLSMAYIESRYTTTSVSRKVCQRVTKRVALVGLAVTLHPIVCQRQTGPWQGRLRGPRWVGPYFCGTTQLEAQTWQGCLDLRDQSLADAYAATVADLETWLDDPACNGSMKCALAGYDGGYKAVKKHTTHYAQNCLLRAKWIWKLVKYVKPRNDV